VKLKFSKMHGLGNDFVVLDGIRQNISLSPEQLRYLPPIDGFPGDDDEAAALAMNRWIEDEIRRNPAQYLWVHKRFKTRPEGEASLYGPRAG